MFVSETESATIKNYRRRMAQVGFMAGKRLDGWTEHLVNLAIAKASNNVDSKAVKLAHGIKLIDWYLKTRIAEVKQSMTNLSSEQSEY